ncbi:MAG: PAS domain S-box protein [Spirochaetes bacterium]|nr:PAS domain S-box protein [Spirochaetota bacterium]
MGGKKRKTSVSSHKKIFRETNLKSINDFASLFSFIAEQNLDIITIFDLEFNILYISPAVTKITGFSVEEAKKHMLREILTPPSYLRALSILHEELEKEKTKNVDYQRSRIFELEHYKKDGSTVWLESHASFIRNERNDPIAILVISRDISHRKEIEGKLSTSEEWYRTLFETSPDPIVVYDFTGNIVDANKRTCELYGVANVEELIADVGNVLNLLDDDDKRKALMNMSNTIKTGFSKGNEYCARNKKGEKIFMEIHSAVLPVTKGKPNLFISIIRDITARKSIEEALRKSEEQYRLLVETAKEGIWKIENHITTYVNRAMAEMMGYTPEEMLGRPIFDFIFEEDLPELHEKLKRRKRGIDEVYEGRRKRKDGSELWAIISAKAIMDANGNYLGSFALYTDITERKKAEAEILNKQKQLEDIIAHMPDPTFVINKHHVVIAWNKAMEDLTGVKSENIIGKGNFEHAIPFYGVRTPILIDLSLEFDDAVAKKYTYIKKEKDILIAETTIENFRGRKTYLWGKAAPLYDKDGNIIGAIETIRDITERKESELALIESEQKFREIFDSTTDSIMIHEITEKGGKIIDCNRQTLEMYGYSTKEEILSGNIGNLSANEYPYTEEMAQQKIALALKGQIPTFEWLAKRKTGDLFWVEVTLKKTTIAGKERVLAIVRDISERKKKEQQLKESEERYRNLAETTQDVIVLHDMNGTIQYINQAGITITGYSYEEIVGTNVFRFLPKSYKKLVFAYHQKRFEGFMGIQEFELEFFDRKGQRIPAQVTSTPIIKEGKAESIMVVIHDLRARKAAEELMRANKQRLESTISVLQYEASTTKELFQHVLDEAIRLTDSKIGFILMYDSEKQQFIPCAWSKRVMEECAIKDSPEIYPLKDAGIWAETVRQKKPIIINDYSADNPLKKGYPQGHVQITRYLGIPIFRNHEPIATVGVANKETEYTEIEVLQLTLLMDAAWKSIERRQILESLKESEEKFRTLSNLTPTGIVMYQNDEIIYVNQAVEYITGYSANEITALLFWNSIHPEDLPMMRTRIQKRIEGDKKIHSYEFRIFAKDGSIKWLHATTSLIQFNAKPTILASIVDITGKKRAEEQLFEEKEKLQITLQSIADGVIATDTRGRVMIINEAAQKLTGYTQKEAEGKQLSDIFHIIHELSGKPLENPVEKVLSTGQKYELSNHTVLISKDGRKHIIADSAAPITDTKGNILGVVLVFRDMTEKMHLLEQAQRAQRLESIGILAGGIAHDFNNILEGVFGYLGLAAININDEKTSQMIHNALKSIQRAKGLTSQLLTFAKGGDPVKKIQPIVPIVIDTVQFITSGSNVRIEFDFAENISNAEFDANQISHVIENITLNAIQAMPHGGVIAVRGENVHFNEGEHPLLCGDYVKITIRDSGIGIPKEILNKIFDPFFTTKSKGQGLGLATSYSIIAKHQGTIEVESEIGIGTAFHIYLPASIAKAEESIKIPEKKKLIVGKILVLDDEPIMQEIMVKFLEHLGFTALVAATGKEAIELFIREKERGNPFNALIFDMTIRGGMSGKDAICEIRKIDPDIPAFVMSGYSDDKVLAQPERFGFNGSLSKPFKIEDLEELLAKFFSEK